MIRRFKIEARNFATLLLKESLDPGRAAAAVFLGIFIGILPIYGFHALAAVGVALLFKLNKPLTVACTFISNPLFQPLLVFSTSGTGLPSISRLIPAALAPLPGNGRKRTHLDKRTARHLGRIIGSVTLALLLGGVGASRRPRSSPVCTYIKPSCPIQSTRRHEFLSV